MIPWWVCVIAFMGGSMFGFLIAAVLSANERDERP